MKLIFSADAIFPPLTGIGRYAWELAVRLRRHPEIEAIRFFSWGRWVEDAESLRPRGLNEPGRRGRETAGLLRRWLAKRNWAVDMVSLVGSSWMKQRLRPYRDYLFHSPNYFIPPGTGPAIATVHDLSIYHYPEMHPAPRVRYWRREFPKALKRAQHLITDSESVRREIIGMFGWPEEHVTAIPLGVDSDFHPRTPEELLPALTEYRLRPNEYTLCVATTEPRKNIRRLLAAYQALPDAVRRNYPLVLAGSRGWLTTELETCLDRAQRQGWARHLGYVPQRHLPALFAGARAFCFPSLYEGFGLPVLESMASGVPVLTSRSSSLEEVSGGAAWLVDPLDVDAIREGVANVLTNDAWREAARSQGLSIAGQMTWDECALGTCSVYRRVNDFFT